MAIDGYIAEGLRRHGVDGYPVLIFAFALNLLEDDLSGRLYKESIVPLSTPRRRALTTIVIVRNMTVMLRTTLAITMFFFR